VGSQISVHDKVFINVRNDKHYSKVGVVEKIVDDELWIRFGVSTARLWIYKKSEVLGVR